jgi:hypothetical protein
MENSTPGYAGVTGPRGRKRSLNGLALQLSAVALSFTLVALLVVHTSKQAFTAATPNNGNNVAAPTVVLTDNGQAVGAMFNVSNATPGNNYDECIKVTYTGTYAPPTPVQLYGLASQAPVGSLAPYLTLSVDMAPATIDAFRDCSSFPSTGTTNVYSGTLSSFYSTRSTYLTTGSGQNTWTPASTGDARTFRFRVTVVDGQPAAQGQSATNFGFTWETRSS